MYVKIMIIIRGKWKIFKWLGSVRFDIDWKYVLLNVFFYFREGLFDGGFWVEKGK